LEEALVLERSSLVFVAGYDKLTLDVVCLFGSGYAGLGRPKIRGCTDAGRALHSVPPRDATVG
jgi:hypothetical protein